MDIRYMASYADGKIKIQIHETGLDPFTHCLRYENCCENKIANKKYGNCYEKFVEFGTF